MAESGKNCVECGRPMALFSGITINGAAFHNPCWDNGRRLIPPRPETLDQVVEKLQLGHAQV